MYRQKLAAAVVIENTGQINSRCQNKFFLRMQILKIQPGCWQALQNVFGKHKVSIERISKDVEKEKAELVICDRVCERRNVYGRR